MRRQAGAAITVCWLICLAVLFPPFAASEPKISLRLIPKGKVRFTNVLEHFVYLDAEIRDAEQLTVKLLSPEGKQAAFKTKNHIDKGFSACKSATYFLTKGQEVYENLNVCFPMNTAAGTWTIQVTAFAQGKEPAVQEIRVQVDSPQPLVMNRLKQVRAMLIGLEGKEAVSAEKGKIRYIAQNPKDPWFVQEYWFNPAYDLLGGANKKCTRAIFSMALSYLGIDCTPVRMSEMVRSEDIFYTYDAVCEKLGNVVRKEGDLETLWDRYINGEASPVLLHFTYYGGIHGLLLAARDEENPELFYAVTTGQRVNTTAYPDGIRRDAVIPILIEKGEVGERIQSPLLKRYHRGKIDQIWQWCLKDSPEGSKEQPN